MKTKDYKVEYEVQIKSEYYKVEYGVQIKSEYLPQSAFYVDVREDHILPCGDIKSKYVESFAFNAWEKAEEKWHNLREKYEKELLRGKGGILDHQNWIDETSELVQISIGEGEFTIKK